MKTKLLSLMLVLSFLGYNGAIYAAGDADTVNAYRQEAGEYLIGELSSDCDTILLYNTFQSERIFRMVKINQDKSVEDLTPYIPEPLIVDKMLELRPEENQLYFSASDNAALRFYRIDLVTHECSEIEPSALSYLPDGMSFNSVFPPANLGADRAVIVFPDKKASAALTRAEIDRLLQIEQEFYMDRVVMCEKAENRSFFVNFYSGDQVYTVSGYGDVPYASFGEENAIWYMPYVGNARNAIYTAYSEVERAHYDSAADPYEPPAILPKDVLTLPTDEWAVEEIKKAVSKNLLVYPIAGEYQKPITRSEFCDLAVQLLIEKEHPGSSSRTIYTQALESLFEAKLGTNRPDLSMSFTDMEYPTTQISYLTALGVLNGRDDGSFDPDGTISREEAAKILCLVAGVYVDISKDVSSEGISREEIFSPWAVPYVNWVVDKEIMKGTGNGMFSPQNTYTRQEAIATMNRLFDFLKDVPAFTPVEK